MHADFLRPALGPKRTGMQRVSARYAGTGRNRLAPPIPSVWSILFTTSQMPDFSSVGPAPSPAGFVFVACGRVERLAFRHSLESLRLLWVFLYQMGATITQRRNTGVAV